MQANLNQSAVASLGSKVPMELFTGLPVTTPLDTCLIPEAAHPLNQVDLGNVEESLSRLRDSLHAMHMEVVDRKERHRLYQQAKKWGETCNFSAGDFVLWSRVDASLESGKLLVRWHRPFQVEEVKSHSFMIRHLLMRAVHEVHGSRLIFYHDPSLEMLEVLVEHIAQQGIVLGLEAILQHRFNEVSQQYELLISWTGLESIEDSWESFAMMLADIPTKVKEYVALQNDTQLRSLCGLQNESQQ
ncbi:unnamed protein product [Phytophthora fragariaefolia]|uniref:Unnamed protein product n=1 Tax=Phytophthora fragariaefolia TaxID=1490495 RepID=A0A9W7CU30_9STRA|nr:unnamed protein product [Phytophthora fragariaefolia]